MQRRLLILVGIGAALGLTSARAQAGECTSGLCGTPEQSGGGGCGCVDGSILVNMTDRGKTYQFADDFDGDGIEDEFDNCPFTANVDQTLDADGDGVGDVCDNCVLVSNAPATGSAQPDLDQDGIGDACDDDRDGDGVLNDADNCPDVFNPSQVDTDGDGLGNACDDDIDGDGIKNVDDPCPMIANAAAGTAGCDGDMDEDQIPDPVDNCPTVANTDQIDTDGDGKGDACDDDIDGDGVANFNDNCPYVVNASQVDLDKDGKGDAGNFEGGPGSCDHEECYYPYLGAPDCLSATGAFSIALNAVSVQNDGSFKTGDEIGFALISNRLKGAMHIWTARLAEQPGDSQALLSNATGTATTLDPSPQVASCLRTDDTGRCVELNNIRLKPDVHGRYVLKVTAELPDGDPQGLNQTAATASVTLDVTGDDKSGCSAVGGTGALIAGLLSAAGLISRRRRRE